MTQPDDAPRKSTMNDIWEAVAERGAEAKEVAEAAGDVAVKSAIPLAKNKYKLQIIKALISKAVSAVCAAGDDK